MRLAVMVVEYLNEIREEACRHCAREIIDDPSSGPGNTPCGKELPLEQLLETITLPVSEEDSCADGSDREGPPHADFCPCPKEKLAHLAVDAAETLEQRRRRRELLLDQWNDG
jgi:hypothetical protein